MELINPLVEQYAEAFTTPEDELLQEVNVFTAKNHSEYQMLSGHLQGRILAMISCMVAPKRILEIGTYTGYSAICLSEGLTHDGILHTIDINEELMSMTKKYFAMAGCEKKIKTHTGDAVKIIPTLKETFDVVFIDADKKNYAVYFDLVIGKVRKGGIIIADNVLWSGKVLEAAATMDTDTKAISEFNKKIRGDQRVESLLLPVRDGLTLMRVK